LSLKSGKDIIIEERGSKEVATLLSKRNTAPKGIKVMNPAFDVTGHRLITAIITDYGIILPPFNKNIRRLLC
jgi:methylthioribose-1-phosphate isomerase